MFVSHERNFVRVVQKAGEMGCFLYGASRSPLAVPGTKCDAVSTIGAGDTFLAAFVAANLKGLDDIDCCHVANVAAAIACTKPYTSIVTRKEIQDVSELDCKFTKKL